MSTSIPFEGLMQRIGYRFNQPALLRQAMTHRSYGLPNNERLEFVGDSILNYTVARMLFDQFPALSEGALSRLRANLVNQSTLAEIATQLELGGVLKLGEGELKSGGSQRPSILADAVEALFAAVCFDRDFAAAEQVVRKVYQPRIAAIDPTRHAKDAKTRLQEILQAHKYALPCYRIESMNGDPHDQVFHVLCELSDVGVQTQGQGTSRRLAEQRAAEAALECLSMHPLPRKR